MKNSEKENYLRDFVTKEANSNATLCARKTRAYAILAEITMVVNYNFLYKFQLIYWPPYSLQKASYTP